VQRIMPQHLFHGGKLLNGLRLTLRQMLFLLLLLLVGKSVLMFHDSRSGGFLEVRRKGLARAVKFAADGIRRLFRQRRNLVVAHLFVGDEEQQQSIFSGQLIQGFLDAQAQLFGFEHAQRRIGAGRRRFPDGVIRVGNDVAIVPGLLEVAAMIDRDAVEPRAERRIAAKLIHLAKRLKEYVMSGVLGLVRITEKPQREVVDGTAVLRV